MENTFEKQASTGSFAIFILAAVVAPGLAALITYFVGAYGGIGITPRPGYMMPDAAFYSLDIITRVIFGISLVFTARQIAESDGARTMKTVAVTLWLVSYALSLIWLPVFFTMESYMAAFVLLAVIAALTTAQFLINIRISLPAALMVLPYWGFVIYCAYVNLMIAL